MRPRPFWLMGFPASSGMINEVVRDQLVFSIKLSKVQPALNKIKLGEIFLTIRLSVYRDTDAPSLYPLTPPSSMHLAIRGTSQLCGPPVQKRNRGRRQLKIIQQSTNSVRFR